MFIVSTKKQIYQPYVATRADVNPRLRGVTEIFFGGTPRVSLLQRRTLTYNSAGVGYFNNGLFGAVLTTSTASRANMTPANRMFPIPNQGTIAIEVLRITTSNTGGTIFGYENGASDRILLHAPFTDGNLYFDFGNATTGTGGGRIGAAYTKKLNTVTRFVCIAGPTKGREVWVDGNLLVANANANFSSTKATNLFNIGAASNVIAGEANNVSLLVASSVEWTSAEAVAWCRDPYTATFINYERFIKHTPLFPTLSNARMTSLTSTQGVPNVNYAF